MTPPATLLSAGLDRLLERERDPFGFLIAEALETAAETIHRGDVQEYPPLDTPLDQWLAVEFPAAVTAPMGVRHRRLWSWFEALEAGRAARPHVESWPRGGAKSTSTELGVVRVGMKQTRRFALYVSATQSQANQHVASIARHLESVGMPRAVNEYGAVLGWRLDMLRAANGFSVLALGLDAAARGVKLGDDRPDLIVLDDVDDRHDSEDAVKKRRATLTDTILPAGAAHAAILFVQNRIHAGSLMAELLDGRADYLLRAERFEEPAVYGLKLDQYLSDEGKLLWKIVAGTPTWEGQDLATCERQINDWGRGSFLREAQHEVDDHEDGLWDRARDLDPHRTHPEAVPALHRITVGVDPNATSGGDEAGVVVAGVAWRNGQLHGFVLEDATVDGGPRAWASAAVDAYKRWGADRLVAESNNGGEMVAITIGTVPGAPPVRLVHASRGKLTRAEPVQTLYEQGRVHHAGTFHELERELTRWRPGMPSPNRLDALVWAITDLMLQSEAPRRRLVSQSYVTP